MKKYLTVFGSFVIMLCIGSVYAYSIIASELISKYNFTTANSQVIFGTIIAFFPLTMIFVGKLAKKMRYKYFGYIAGILFFAGYALATYSNGNFILMLLGIGVLGGIATGFGYWLAITSPVQWFPEKKGLITGVATAGFGLGAIFMSEIFQYLLGKGYSVFEIFKIIAIGYGSIIVIISNFLFQPETVNDESEVIKVRTIVNNKLFRKLILGMFLGTFAGLLIIGNLNIIGSQHDISNHFLVLGVAFFALFNFLGRLLWGIISDHIGASKSIFLSLLFQSLSIFSLNLFQLSEISYLIISLLIGFGFGGNFVLFAKETAHEFGVKNFGSIYPYVFLGYAIAGLTGPISGGILFDLANSFFYSITLSSVMSLAGSILFFREHLKSKNLITNNP